MARHRGGGVAIADTARGAGPLDWRWQPFVWASLAAAVLPGFGMGALLFGAILARWPLGGWWPAVAQAHGHAQVFGFAGLMVLGVAFSFLPRLRGAPLAGPRFVPAVLACYGGGVLLREIGQMGGASLDGSEAPALPRLVCAALLGVSGPLTLAGAMLAIALLVRTAMRGPALASRAGARQVLPLLAAGWLGLWLALAVNAYGTLQAAAAALSGAGTGGAAGGGRWLMPPAADAVAVRLGLLGWLVPLSVAFSARNFPLFLRTPPAPPRALRRGLGILIGGLLLDVASRFTLGSVPLLEAAGKILEGVALVWFTITIGALGPKVRFAGTMRDAHEATLARLTCSVLAGAYDWLAIGGLLMTLAPVATLAGWAPPPEDAERHALGAGYVLLLVVGMGLRLLPGFAGARQRTVRLAPARVAIGAAHAAAALRVVPVLAVWALPAAAPWQEPLATAALACAGAAGLIAITALMLALQRPLSDHVS